MSYIDDLGNIWTNPEDIEHAMNGGISSLPSMEAIAANAALQESAAFDYDTASEETASAARARGSAALLDYERAVALPAMRTIEPIVTGKKDLPFVIQDIPTLDGSFPEIAPTGGSTFIGTDFSAFLGGGLPMTDNSFLDTSVLGGIEFPSLSGLLNEALNFGMSNFANPIAGIVSTQAPNAPLLGGACPPGRVLRRVALGRDKCVKKPHMNVCNRHALGRSTRRVAGFLHMAKSTEKKMKESFGSLLHTPKSRSRSVGRCGGCGQTSRKCAC